MIDQSVPRLDLAPGQTSREGIPLQASLFVPFSWTCTSQLLMIRKPLSTCLQLTGPLGFTFTS